MKHKLLLITLLLVGCSKDALDEIPTPIGGGDNNTNVITKKYDVKKSPQTRLYSFRMVYQEKALLQPTQSEKFRNSPMMRPYSQRGGISIQAKALTSLLILPILFLLQKE